MGRAPCCDKANVKKGPWSPEEDATLKEYIEQHGTGGNWIALPQKIGLKRCGKSCRLRWLNYLRPNIKHGGFTEEEDNLICSLYISIGSRWSIIAAQLPGRTDNDIKNYWNTRLKKKLLGRRKQSRMNRLSVPENEQEIANSEEENPFLQNLSNSALERLQLHMQLQNLQNPCSFYNNPALWPKQNNVLQEKMTQTLENPPMEKIQILSLPYNHQQSRLVERVEFLENSPNGTSLSSSSSQDNHNVFIAKDLDGNMCDKIYVPQQTDSSIQHINPTLIQADVENFMINYKSSTVGFQSLEGQIAELESCLIEIDDEPRVGLKWWSSNDVEANSASSSSWESTCFLPQSEEIYNDYTLGGYNM